MRRLPLLALSLSLLTLGACEDSTGPSDNILRYRGIIGSVSNSLGQPVGFATVNLPREAGTMTDLPALTCYVRNQNDPDPVERETWYTVSSSIADDTNCLLERSGSGLAATLIGEEIGWEYQFVVVY